MADLHEVVRIVGRTCAGVDQAMGVGGRWAFGEDDAFRPARRERGVDLSGCGVGRGRVGRRLLPHAGAFVSFDEPFGGLDVPAQLVEQFAVDFALSQVTFECIDRLPGLTDSRDTSW